MNEPRQLPRLTSLRWFAALAVFVCHIALHRHGLRALTVGGPVGVGFFFVLSGFVLTWSWRGEPARQFYLRRFARIYPATFVSLTVGVMLWAVSLRGAQVTHWVWPTFGLLQSWFPVRAATHSANPVTWSLACEAFFYATMPFGIPLVRKFPGTVLGLASCAAVVVFVATMVVPGFLYYCPATRLPEFAIGAALAVLSQRGWRPTPKGKFAIPALGIGVGLASGVPQAYEQQQVALALPGVVMVLLWAVSRDLVGASGWLASARFVYLGELSFSFYLTHYLCLLVVEGFVHGIPSVTILGFATAFGSAVALHHGVEIPVQRWIMRAFCDSPRGKATRAALSTQFYPSQCLLPRQRRRVTP